MTNNESVAHFSQFISVKDFSLNFEKAKEIKAQAKRRFSYKNCVLIINNILCQSCG